MDRIINKIKSINSWHFVWMAVVISETATFVVSTIQCEIRWGHVPDDIYIIGAIDALFAPLLIVPVLIILVSQISKLKQELTSRKEAEQQIRVLAYYDSLTSLPNRVFFKELLDRAISYADRHNLDLAVLFIDLDNFKRINDTLGHEKGDKLLRAVTERLLKSLRSSDFIARWHEDMKNEVADVMSRLGGDEFILLLHNLIHPQDAGRIAHRILKDISEPFALDGREVFITGSIGISLFPTDGSNADDLLKNADVAMYYAKSRGRNNYQYFSKSMTQGAEEQMTLKNKLHRALENKEFVVYYQPIQSLSQKRLIGLEALLRWKPNYGDMLLPSQFISIAEETGLILPIGKWVLQAACLQNKAWQEAGNAPLVISVNLSNRQFDQQNLVEVVTEALGDAGLQPQYLELEITESAIMQDQQDAISTMRKLRDMGVRISIDDFGTGYSSLNYLSKFPLNSLKIDRSFIMNIGKSPSDGAIIRAIIALAHGLNLRVIAEGVETEQQRAFLQQHGCDEIQGYLVSPPLSAEEISKLSICS